MHSWLNHRPQSNALVLDRNQHFLSDLMLSFHLVPDPLPLQVQPQEDRLRTSKELVVHRPAEVYASGMVNMPKHSCSTTDCWPWGRVKPTASPSKGNYCNSKADYTLKLSNLVQDNCQTLDSCCPFGIPSTVRTNQTALLSLENA